MYIRTVSRKNKDGSNVEYVQLAHNVWNSKKRHSTPKVLYNFGRRDTLDLNQLKRLVKSICRFLPPEDALEAQVLMKNLGRKFKWRSSRSYGGIYVLSEIWKQLGFTNLIKKRLNNRNFSTPVERAVFAMVANCCLAPKSKLAITEWIDKKVYIPDLSQIGVQVLYRSMDFILEHQNKLEEEIYWAVQ